MRPRNPFPRLLKQRPSPDSWAGGFDGFWFEAFGSGGGVLSVDSYADSAARGEFAVHESVARLASGDEIIEDLVDDRLVERSGISEGGEVKFQRLGFDTKLVGNIFDADFREVGLACDWAHGSELSAFESDPVVALGAFVLESFEGGGLGFFRELRGMTEEREAGIFLRRGHDVEWAMFGGAGQLLGG